MNWSKAVNSAAPLSHSTPFIRGAYESIGELRLAPLAVTFAPACLSVIKRVCRDPGLDRVDCRLIESKWG
jgi:hypothetical protein